MYTGQEYDSDIAYIELYNLRARYYNTDYGRFICEDPLLHINSYGVGCGKCYSVLSSGFLPDNSYTALPLSLTMFKKELQRWNAYTYVGNNSLNYTDPTGKGWGFFIGGVLALIFGKQMVKGCFCGVALYHLGALTKQLKEVFPDDDPNSVREGFKTLIGSDQMKDVMKYCPEFITDYYTGPGNPFSAGAIP